MIGALQGRRRSIVSAGGLRGGALVARALVGLAMARFLGAAEVGAYFLVVAAGGLVALVARAGLDRLALAEVGRHPEAARTITLALGRRLVATSAAATLLGVLIASLAPLPDGVDRLAVVMILASVIPMNVAQLGANVLRGMQRTSGALLIGELAPPLLRLAAFLALPMAPSANRAGVAFLVGWVVVAAVVVAVLVRPRPDTETASGWTVADPWRQTGPLFTFSVVSQLRELAANGMVWLAGTPADVGGFGTATRLTQMSLLPTTATRFVTAPELVSRGGTLDRATATLVVRTARRAMAIQLPISLAIGVLTPQLLGLLGSDFRPAADLLRILLIGGVVNAATGSTTQLLLMSDHRRRLATSSAVGLAVLLVVSGALAPLIGVAGVAVGMAAANAAAGLVEWWFVRADLGLRVDVLAPGPGGGP